MKIKMFLAKVLLQFWPLQWSDVWQENEGAPASPDNGIITDPGKYFNSYRLIYINSNSYYLSLSSACGGTLSGTGQLRSPYHPNAYPHNKVCEWVINQPEGSVVKLNFLSFDIEGGSCRFDFVEVGHS